MEKFIVEVIEKRRRLYRFEVEKSDEVKTEADAKFRVADSINLVGLCPVDGIYKETNYLVTIDGFDVEDYKNS